MIIINSRHFSPTHTHIHTSHSFKGVTKITVTHPRCKQKSPEMCIKYVQVQKAFHAPLAKYAEQKKKKCVLSLSVISSLITLKCSSVQIQTEQQQQKNNKNKVE